MTRDEAIEFLDAVFVAFPGVHQWLKTASPNVEATKAVWAKTLEQITLDEGFGVLSRWTSGALPVPTGYEKEHFVLHLRAVVMRDRSEAKRYDVRNEFQRTHKRGQSTFQYDPILGPFLADVMRVHGQWCNGTISESERDREIMRLEREALGKVGQKKAG
ncbi:hypothetical protein SH449x_004094 [Pirellulaceae bacterium SH449]